MAIVPHFIISTARDTNDAACYKSVQSGTGKMKWLVYVRVCVISSEFDVQSVLLYLWAISDADEFVWVNNLERRNLLQNRHISQRLICWNQWKLRVRSLNQVCSSHLSSFQRGTSAHATTAPHRHQHIFHISLIWFCYHRLSTYNIWRLRMRMEIKSLQN